MAFQPTFFCFFLELHRYPSFHHFLRMTVFSRLSGGSALDFPLLFLHLFLLLLIRLSVLLTVIWYNLEGEIEYFSQTKTLRKACILYYTCSTDAFSLTCVTVRRILRPLSGSLRLASMFSSSPDNCSSSG